MASSLVRLDELLKIDAVAEVERIGESIRNTVLRRFRKRGAVVGVSGGIDSAVVAFLCVRAMGPERVVALLMPERDSSGESTRLGREVASQLGIRHFIEDIGPLLDAVRCYERRDQAVRSVVPEYGPGYKMKIVLPGILSQQKYSLFSVVVQSPSGRVSKHRLTLDAYLEIVASTNFKQRTRKMMEYYYADRFNYAVAGTPNRLEYDLGFFVKNGDGAADFKPIAHLYKSQVYQISEYLGVPEEIRRRTPTTDTYSLEQTQEEFYFSLPLQKMDLCLYARDHNIEPETLAPVIELMPDQVRRVYQEIDAKRQVAQYLRTQPVLVEE